MTSETLYIIEALKTLIESDRDIFSQVIAPCYLCPDGAIEIRDNNGNRQLAGIADNAGNYCYVRFRTKEATEHSYSDQRTPTDKNRVTTIPLRLVGIFRRMNSYEVSDRTENTLSLFNQSMEGKTFRQAKYFELTLEKTWHDVQYSLPEESEGNVLMTAPDLIIIAIDFNISFTRLPENCRPQIQKP